MFIVGGMRDGCPPIPLLFDLETLCGINLIIFYDV